MKKFTIEQYVEAKEMAKELGINYVGKTKETLVNEVNEKLAAAQQNKKEKVKKEKWYANGYGFQPGDVVDIQYKVIEKNGEIKHILHGRNAVIIGPSANKNMVKAYLTHPKTGEQLNCPITLDINLISLYIPNNEDQEKTEGVAS
jgi:hypothetical protein